MKWFYAHVLLCTTWRQKRRSSPREAEQGAGRRPQHVLQGRIQVASLAHLRWRSSSVTTPVSREHRHAPPRAVAPTPQRAALTSLRPSTTPEGAAEHEPCLIPWRPLSMLRCRPTGRHPCCTGRPSVIATIFTCERPAGSNQMLAAESPSVRFLQVLQRGGAGAQYSPTGSTLAWSMPPQQHAARSAHLAPSSGKSTARPGGVLR